LVVDRDANSASNPFLDTDTEVLSLRRTENDPLKKKQDDCQYLVGVVPSGMSGGKVLKT
jgi:hypothetical protein